MVGTGDFGNFAATSLLICAIFIAWVVATSFLHAATLMFVVRWQLDQGIRYWDAYKVSVVANTVSGVASILVFYLAIAGLVALFAARFISINFLAVAGANAILILLHCVWFVVCARIYRKWLRISRGQAARVMLAHLLVYFGVAVAIVLLVLAPSFLIAFWERIPRGLA